MLIQKLPFHSKITGAFSSSFSHIARYAPSIQSKIRHVIFGRELTFIIKHPLNLHEDS